MLSQRAAMLLLLALSLLMAGGVLFASWLPESKLSELDWLPDWAGRIADFHPNLRTAIPFVPLAMVLGGVFARAGMRRPEGMALLACLACVGLAEAGQFFLPNRTADWRDVACGALGALVGIAVRQIPGFRRKTRPRPMPDASPEKNWIVCQIGARENYTIPRALHRAGRLEMLVTDIWHQPGGLVGDWMSGGRMFRRWHEDLADARVCAANRSHLTFEAFTRARNDAKTWGAIVRRNERFQRNCLRLLRRHAASRPGEHFTVFAFSYAARDIFQFAKSQGWTTVLGQIDPGPHEENLVAEEHRRHPQCGSTWKAAPPAYWEQWREETELADSIICNSDWARDGLAAAGVPMEKIRIVPLFYEADEKRSADLPCPSKLQQSRKSARDAETGGLPPTPRLRRAEKSALHPDHGRRTKDAPLEVLFIGNVCLRKGIARLIEAMQLLRGKPVHLSIYGHLSVSPNLWRGMPNVSWVGSVRNPDIGSVYAAADVFILPTISDGFARTQLESLAAGTPVIASRHCGKVVLDGRNGFVLNDNTPEEIAALLATLATDRDRLAACDTTLLPEDFPRTLDALSRQILGTANRSADLSCPP
jgi:glycosyltransferase involved in cell wall biosynthesis